MLLLLGLELGISRAARLLRMVNRAGWISAHLMDGVNVTALGDDCVAGKLAYLELGRCQDSPGAG